jgi:hypothetical protein
MTLAAEAAAALGVDAQEREELIGTALCVGQWLAQEGRPGQWDAVDAGSVLRAMAFSDAHQSSTFLFALATLFGHAGLQERVPAPAARRVLRQIGTLAEHPTVAAFAVRTADRL